MCYVMLCYSDIFVLVLFSLLVVDNCCQNGGSIGLYRLLITAVKPGRVLASIGCL